MCLKSNRLAYTPLCELDPSTGRQKEGCKNPALLETESTSKMPSGITYEVITESEFM